MNSAARRRYWDRVYARRSSRQVPSQFATFVANELEKGTAVIDIGCGSARDSFFFSDYAFEVCGVDASETAIAAAQSLVEAEALEGIRFIQSDMSGASLGAAIADETGKLCIYARFFLHAIDDQEEARLLDIIHASCKVGDILAVEYRTVDDEKIHKEAEPHFRRFIEPADLDARIAQIGFSKTYGVVGRGFAKYKSEDAMVARAMFVRDEMT